MANEFFEGDREVARFELAIPKRGRTSCVVVQRWAELLVRTIDCGSKVTYNVTRRRGLSREDKREVESSVDGKMGVGLLNELALHLKGTVSSTITLEEEVTEEQEFEFAAPDCYQRAFRTYQMQFIIKIDIQWRRWFGFVRRHRHQTLTIWTNEVYQESSVEPRHEPCGCKGREEDSGRVYVSSGPISLIDPYFNTGRRLDIPSVGVAVENGSVFAIAKWVGTGAWRAPEGQYRTWNNQSVRVSLDALFSAPHDFTYEIFPAHLRYLSWVNDQDAANVRFSPIPEAGPGPLVGAGVR